LAYLHFFWLPDVRRLTPPLLIFLLRISSGSRSCLSLLSPDFPPFSLAERASTLLSAAPAPPPVVLMDSPFCFDYVDEAPFCMIIAVALSSCWLFLQAVPRAVPAEFTLVLTLLNAHPVCLKVSSPLAGLPDIAPVFEVYLGPQTSLRAHSCSPAATSGPQIFPQAPSARVLLFCVPCADPSRSPTALLSSAGPFSRKTPGNPPPPRLFSPLLTCQC